MNYKIVIEENYDVKVFCNMADHALWHMWNNRSFSEALHDARYIAKIYGADEKDIIIKCKELFTC